MFRDDALQRDFESRGFVTVPLLSPAEAAPLRERVLAVYEARDVSADAAGVKQGYHVSALHPDPACRRAADAVVRDVVVERLTEILSGYRYAFGSFVIKRPGDGLLDVHRDWNLTADPEETALNCWMPLVNVTDANGALGLIAGSHHALPGNIAGLGVPVFFGEYAPNLKRASQITPLRAGEAVIFDLRVLHWSTGNSTGEPRPTLNAVLIPDRSRLAFHRADRASDGARLQIVGAEGTDNVDFLLNAVTAPSERLRVTGSIDNRNRSMTQDEFEQLVGLGAEPAR